MTTITWIDKETGEGKIQIIKSKDKLENILQDLKCLPSKKGEKVEHFIEVKEGRKTRIKILHSVSYETGAERALFRSYEIIPKKDEYRDSEGGDSDD